MQNYKEKFVRLALKAAIFTLQTLFFFQNFRLAQKIGVCHFVNFPLYDG
jgi:hypothetical protein